MSFQFCQARATVQKVGPSSYGCGCKPPGSWNCYSSGVAWGHRCHWSKTSHMCLWKLECRSFPCLICVLRHKYTQKGWIIWIENHWDVEDLEYMEYMEYVLYRSLQTLEVMVQLQLPDLGGRFESRACSHHWEWWRGLDEIWSHHCWIFMAFWQHFIMGQ